MGCVVTGSAGARQDGSIGWVYGAKGGLLRVPGPLGDKIRFFLEKTILAYLGPKGLRKFLAWAKKIGQNRPKWPSKVLGPFLALLGPFLIPLGISVGPNVYILSFSRYQSHSEPYEKWSEKPNNVIWHKKYFF